MNGAQDTQTHDVLAVFNSSESLPAPRHHHKSQISFAFTKYNFQKEKRMIVWCEIKPVNHSRYILMKLFTTILYTECRRKQCSQQCW